jgi:acyl carrier protein
MYEFVEPQLRHLVAEHLGVGLEALVSDVSLRDDLAADSLDLVELAMALEGAFAIVVPERILDEVRTYGDLVHATGLLIRAHCEATARGAEPPLRVRARIVPATGDAAGTFERSGWLTPYTAETIAENALGAGKGVHLEVTVATRTAADLDRVTHRFARLRTQGVQVTVQRDAERHRITPAAYTPP